MSRQIQEQPMNMLRDDLVRQSISKDMHNRSQSLSKNCLETSAFYNTKSHYERAILHNKIKDFYDHEIFYKDKLIKQNMAEVVPEKTVVSNGFPRKTNK